AQEIEKLKLLHGDASIDFDMMAAAVADSARYDIYGLVDAALGANVKRFTRMLAGLRAEGSESVLILWALTREIRSLQAMAAQMEQGQSLEQVVAKARVWPKRKALVIGALRRHKSGVWMVLLQRAAGLDRIIKGQSSGNIWDELLQLCLAIAGIRLFRSNHSATAANG
ncbi:DNA polymerase III subunit delta, partial [Kaarinaea lacus]